jgi:tryptophanyl-tRNA synthetase
MKRRLFSGIQPTGDIHIGNYLGAIKEWVSLQKEYETILCIVDLHAITSHQEPARLKSKIREVAALLIAAGIDPEKTPVFIQSHISAHAELAWVLECTVPFGWLNRMTQFKDKEKEQQSVSAGLFCYPALMAADILLYRTDAVPVGEDQLQHIELTRDLAQRFNSIYGDTFILPEPIVPDNGARIMGLDDPTRKMSKSNEQPGHAIYLLDSPDVIRTKIARATTDSFREIRFDENRPGVSNLLVLFEAFSGKNRQEVESQFEGKGYNDLKRELSDVIIDTLKPLQERYRELISNQRGIDVVLEEGEARVRPLAEKTLFEVKARVGLG